MLLREECLCSRIFQVMGEFANGVRWISRRNDSTSPVSAPSYEWRINAILCEKCEDVALLPEPFGAETRAEAGCCFSESGICEIALCDGIKVYYWN